jgi:hypothetical protein
MTPAAAGSRVVVQSPELPMHGQRGTVLGHYERLVPLVLVKLDDGELLLTQLSDLASAERAAEPSAAA